MLNNWASSKITKTSYGHLCPEIDIQNFEVNNTGFFPSRYIPVLSEPLFLQQQY